MNKWKLQEAKAHFSEVIRCVVKEGPQEIMLCEESESVVIISKNEYDKLVNSTPNLVTFLRQSPLFDLNLDLSRKDSLIGFVEK